MYTGEQKKCNNFQNLPIYHYFVKDFFGFYCHVSPWKPSSQVIQDQKPSQN